LLFILALPTTLGYKTCARKHLRPCHPLQTKFKSTHFKNLQKSTCFIALVVGMWANHTQTLLSTESKKSNCQRSLI